MAEPTERPTRPGARRGRTATSAFGVGRRESHDASAFYERFTPPELSDDATVVHPDDRPLVDEVVLGDLRARPDTVAPGSVALVVTSPPYFAGKEYETALGEGGVPGTYAAYLDLLTEVFGACATALEPGGRIAVNVANLGRKPYRSLSADVVTILQDRLGLLLRGEIVWQKARAAGGNCAWGTFQRPGDPVLRDLTERVIVASKQRFDRAVPAAERAARGLPHEATISRDEFLDATVDLWELPPESATRVNHPAPFPVSLPQRLIELYTYRDDLILDPFLGSGSTAVAAVRTGRRWLGYDTDPAYVERARARLAAEIEARGDDVRAVTLGPGPVPKARPDLGRAWREGRRLVEVAALVLADAGWTVDASGPRLGAGVVADLAGHDPHGRDWAVTVVGGRTTTASGLRRGDALWSTIGRAAVVSAMQPATRFLVLAADVPGPTSHPGRALAAVTGPGRPIRAVVDLGAPDPATAVRALGAAPD